LFELGVGTISLQLKIRSREGGVMMMRRKIRRRVEEGGSFRGWWGHEMVQIQDFFSSFKYTLLINLSE